MSERTTINWDFAPHVSRVFEEWRYKVLYGGRGGVKSWTAAMALLIDGYRQRLRIGCFREIQKSIDDSVHTLLKDQIERLGLSSFYDVQQKKIRGRNGTEIVFAGLSNLTAESIKSYEGLDRVWVEEAASVTRRSWDILVPTIRQDGSQIWVTFNPDLDTDETWQRFIEKERDDALVVECSYHNNPWFPEVLETERQEFLRDVELGIRTQDEYDNIWGGKCKPSVDGAVFAPQVAKAIKERRLTAVPHEPSLYTHTVWDLGYNDNMVIAFVQRTGSSVRFIDYIEDSHRDYESYVKQIREIVSEKGYRVAIDGREGGYAWLPHDGKQTRADTGKSPCELVNGFGLKVPRKDDGWHVVPDIGIKGRIEAGRQMFPRVLFDKENCSPLFNRLRRYARRISPETGQPGAIKKDGNDHAGDMFTYAAVIEKELTNESDAYMEPLNYNYAGRV